MARPSSTDRAKRMLALLHVFDAGDTLAVADIAAALGTDSDTVERDLELLSCCGIAEDPDSLVPIIVEDGMVTVFGALPALSEPVRLSAGEAAALAAALSAAGMSAADPLPRKLLAAAAARDTDAAELERVVRAAVSPGAGYTLEPLALAIEQHLVVRIEYRAYGRLGENERTIEPLSTLQELGVWYVRAYCRETDAIQTFRLDRIRNARLTRERFTPRDTQPPASSALPTAGLPVATVRLANTEPFSAREWPGARIVAEDGAGVTIEVPFAGTAWVSRQVVARLGRAEAISPAEVRAAVAALAREELARLG